MEDVKLKLRKVEWDNRFCIVNGKSARWIVISSDTFPRLQSTKLKCWKGENVETALVKSLNKCPTFSLLSRDISQ